MVMVEETYMPLTLFAPNLSDSEFQALCNQYPDFHLEYTADGEVVIMPPTDPETGVRNAAITKRLGIWADSTGGGLVTDSSAGFILPDQSRRSPDAAWITRAKLLQRPTCPEFVVELLSPFDSRKKAHLKMIEWIANGAQLGWLIDPFQQTVTIYRPGQDVEVRREITQIEGEGPVAGFVLDLREIWDV